MTTHDFEDDPMGPFGTGPVIEEPDEPWVDPVSDGFGADGAYGPVGYTDPIYEAFGDYDAFGPFASRDIDYLADEDGQPYPEEG
jgi:hypothetical protein